jgi:uncharacterized protein with beta-barrel porin domain
MWTKACNSPFVIVVLIKIAKKVAKRCVVEVFVPYFFSYDNILDRQYLPRKPLMRWITQILNRRIKTWAAVFLILAVTCGQARAVDVTVDSTADPLEAGHVTLRDAIGLVNAGGEASNNISFSLAGSISLATYLPEVVTLVSSSLTLANNSGGNVTITASGLSYVLSVDESMTLSLAGANTLTFITSSAGTAAGLSSGTTTSNKLMLGSIGQNVVIQTTTTGDNSFAYGILAEDSLTSTGNLAGSVQSSSSGSATPAYGIYAGADLLIGGDLAATVAAATSGYASFTGGVSAADTLTITGNLSGAVSATASGFAGPAVGVDAGSDIIITGVLSGSVTATATGRYGIAMGMYSPCCIDLGGGISRAGRVQATATGARGSAWGIYSSSDISITGDLAGAVTATASGTEGAARGIIADNDLAITTLSGSVTTTASGNAYGLAAGNDLAMLSGLSGTVTATSQTSYAYGIYAMGTLNGGAVGTPLSISGSVTATGYGLAVAVSSERAMNLTVTGTLRGVDTSGRGGGYAIKSGSADDTVTLGTGATLIGTVDLGGGTNTLTLLGSGSVSSKFVGVATLTAGDGSTITNWSLAPAAADASTFGSLAVTTGATLTLNEYVAIAGNIVDNASLIYNLGGVLSYGGVISGSGTITKTGSGTLSLTGDSSGFAGQTTVAQGLLFMGASGALGGTVTVNPGGTVGGYGTVGNLVNNGVVSPGGSIGTLHVSGNYVQGATGVYYNEVAANGTGDLLAVSGTATLNGGLLSVNPQPGYYFAGTTWTVLTASGGISGTYDAVRSSSPTLVFTTSNMANIVTMTVSRIPYASFAMDGRSLAVAFGLDAAVTSGYGDLANLFSALDFSSAAGIRFSLGMLSPEPYDAFTQSIFDAGRVLSAAQRAGIHAGAASGSPAFASPLDTGPATLLALNDLTNGQGSLPVFPSGLGSAPGAGASGPDIAVSGGGVFLKSFGMLANQSAGSERTGYFSTTGGVTGGIRVEPLPGLTLGLAPGYFSQHVSLQTAGGGHGAVTDWNVTLLGAYRREAWFVDGLVRVGYDSLRATRNIAVPNLYRTARGVWSGWNTTGAFGGGYDFHLGDFTFGPLASLEWTHLDQTPFRETRAGALGLAIRGRSDASLTTTLGGRIYRNFETPVGMVTPELRLAWGAQWLGEPRTISASFVGYPQSGFTTKTARHDFHSAILDTGVSVAMSRSLSASARFGVELFRPGYTSQAASLSLKYSF